jgi:hypothetical protein
LSRGNRDDRDDRPERDDRSERPRRSWREIDQRRDGTHTRDDAPRGRAAEKEHAKQSREALKTADALFGMGQGGKGGAGLAKAMRDAHGGGEFDAACRAYADAIGVPRDPALLSLFLDCSDRTLVTLALEALLTLQNGGSFGISAGLKSQLRVLAQDRDDTVAGISEDLLAGA